MMSAEEMIDEYYQYMGDTLDHLKIDWARGTWLIGRFYQVQVRNGSKEVSSGRRMIRAYKAEIKDYRIGLIVFYTAYGNFLFPAGDLRSARHILHHVMDAAKEGNEIIELN